MKMNPLCPFVNTSNGNNWACVCANDYHHEMDDQLNENFMIKASFKYKYSHGRSSNLEKWGYEFHNAVS